MTESRMDLGTVIVKAGQEVAVGKEQKYFWENQNRVISKHRANLVQTLLALHSARRTTVKLDTEEGTYQVKEYQIPLVEWVQTLVNYSHRIYLTQVGAVDEIFVDVTSREVKPYTEEITVGKDSAGKLIKETITGEVVSPEAFKVCLNQIAQYNPKWKSSGEVSKPEIAFSDLHGFFNADASTYYVSNRATESYTKIFTQALEIKIPDFTKYAIDSDKLKDDALIRQLTMNDIVSGKVPTQDPTVQTKSDK